MKRKLLVAAAVPLCVLLLAGCQCEHKWIEANCTTAKICSECGETEGESLGHEWKDADCLTAKICTECGTTEGEPLGHDPGSWIVRRNIVDAEQYKERFCEVCDISLEKSKKENMESFIKQSRFIFSPNDFIKRFEKLAKEYYPDFRYEIDTKITGTGVSLYLDGMTDQGYVLVFTDASTQVRPVEEYDSENVYMVALGKTGEFIEPQGVLIDEELIYAFCQTCDPAFSEDDLYSFNMEYYGSHLGWTMGMGNVASTKINRINYGYFYGYLQSNNFYVHQVSVNPA